MRTSLSPAKVYYSGSSFFAIGSTDLIQKSKIALFCSQRCAPHLISCTYDIVRNIGKTLVFLSGFHSQIEKDCLSVLLRRSHPTIIIQGRRLSTTRFPAEWKKALDAGRLLLISPFSDKQKRVTSELAEERNRFVAALADEVLIAYAHPGGKTEKLAGELLRSGKRVHTFESPANKKLIEWGAIPIQPDYFASKDA